MQGESQALQIGELRMLEVTSLSNTAQRACASLQSSSTDVVRGIGDAVESGSAHLSVGGASRVPPDGACERYGVAELGPTSQSGDDTSDGQFLLALQLEGTSVLTQNDREAKLSPGDFTLCSSTRSSQVDLAPESRYLIVAIPDSLMRRHLTSPDDLVAVRMSGSHGLTGVLSNFIRSLWACRADAADPAVALRMSYTLLDLIAATYSVSPHARHEQSSLVAAHRVRITAYIEAHLRDPNLNPTTVASACKITPRYLHHLFTTESETVTQYIQRRRLEECARALIAVPVRGRLVTEIAFHYGFNSLTHFGRAFRHHFGQTPTNYRRAICDPNVTDDPKPPIRRTAAQVNGSISPAAE